MQSPKVAGYLLGTLLSILASQASAGDDAIATDRPDFVESSDTVGKGRFQLETSIAFERDKSAGFKSRVRSTPTLLRMGVSEDWELRLETDGLMRARVTGPGLDERASGTADVAVGTKWHWRDADEERGTPGMAWLFHVDVDSGSAAFRGQGLRPSVRLTAEWEFAGGWSLGVMPGIYMDRNVDTGKRFAGGILAAVVGKQLTEKVRGFAEIAGQQIASKKNGGTVLTFDTGLTYLINDALQMDFALSRGLNKTTPDLSWTVGVSTKF